MDIGEHHGHSRSVMENIPVEILGMIFRILSSAEWYNGIIECRSNENYSSSANCESESTIYGRGLKACPDWVKVTHVCRSWRSIATGYPDLWTSLDFHNVHWTTLFLRLSCQSPLYVVFEIHKGWGKDKPKPHEDRDMLLSAHYSRIRHLFVLAKCKASWESISSFYGWGPDIYGNLETVNFVLSVPHLVLPDTASLSPDHVSKLRVLRISGYDLAITMNASVSYLNLTHLIICGEIESTFGLSEYTSFPMAIYTLLHTTPQLEVLDIDMDRDMRDKIPPRPKQEQVIRLPCLRRLSLCWSDGLELLGLLSWPSSAVVQIRGLAQGSTTIGHSRSIVSNEFVLYFASHIRCDPHTPIRSVLCETTHRLLVVGSSSPIPGHAPVRFVLDLTGVRFTTDAHGAAGAILPLSDVLSAELSAESFKHDEACWSGLLQCMPRLRSLTVRSDKYRPFDDNPNDSEPRTGYTPLAVLQVLGRKTSEGDWDAPPCVRGVQTLILQNPRLSGKFWNKMEKILSARWMAGGGTVEVRVEDALAGKIDENRALDRLQEAGLVTVSLRDGEKTD